MKRGDLLALPPEVDTVGIIDGVLLTDAAVGHREILSLLRRGIKVYGGGSMGALRAAELSDMGMIGVGRIYEEYASGRVNGDDEVVLAYDPFSLQSLSEPLINLRLNLEAAVAQGVIGREAAEDILDGLKRTYYPKRSYDSLYQFAKRKMQKEEVDALLDFLKLEGMDYKQNDAILLLKAVKEGCNFF